MGFAQNLKYLMEHNDLTNYQLAKELNCSPSSVSNWLSEISRPQKRTVATIAAKFDVSVDALCGEGFPHIKGENRLLGMTPPHKITPAGQEADGREKEFVQLFEKLTPEQQDLFIAQLRGVVDSQDK